MKKLFLKINIKSPLFLLSLFALNVLLPPALKSERLTPMQKMNICTDGYFQLAMGGFERCMRGGADKFWRELNREEIPINGKNWRPMNKDEIRAEQERKDREARAEIDRRENRTKRDGSHHEFKIKATSQRLKIKTINLIHINCGKI